MSRTKKYFGDIYENYVDKIYRFIFLKVGTQEVAEDLTSEVFSRTWQKIKKHNSIGNINAFLYQVARNLVVDHYRDKGQAQFVSVDSVAIADTGESLEARVAVHSELERVKTALAALKDEYREAVTWYYIDELSVPEISKMTKKSEEAVRVTIHRALQTLKERLPDGS